MPTLNRDIQQLNLASNNISLLNGAEFSRKKFGNLQKIYLNGNQLRSIDSSAFNRLTGLIELDLSENFIEKLFDDKQAAAQNQDEENLDDKIRAGDWLQQDSRALAIGRDSSPPSSFLNGLKQLRHLNLASNRLTEIGAFTFSPVAQLHQLYLSR